MIALWMLIATALGQDYMFPTSAADYGTFYPTAYYDHGGADWNCGSIRYSGHRGNDFGVGSWAGMDAGRDVLAAAAGTVVATHDGEFDRCTSGACGTSNYVKIRHADGKETIYYHLKQWTVAVSVGQTVSCGTYLGLVGSSGNSTGPHLHFGVLVNGTAYDPFDGPCSAPPSWWVSQGAYNSRPGRTCDGPVDECPNDPNKTSPGICGCGVPDTNTDGDAWADCQETCDTDPAKRDPGICGCGTPDTNTDGDAWADCQETCDTDPTKRDPGVCGCGVPDTNTDGDALLDCQETCDTDPNKLEPGVCGCGVPDVDSDGDATFDCVDACPADPGKTAPGSCGCGLPDIDSDGDAALDCLEACPLDPAKTEPGLCGCGVPDEDITGDGLADCVTCGDGFVESPETCDDGARDDGDGCSSTCQVEALFLDPPVPGVAGQRNALVTRGVPDGARVVVLASRFLGTTRVPGCPALTVPLDQPFIAGFANGDGLGEATINPLVPSTAAGRSFAGVAVELGSCRASGITLLDFQ